MQLSERSHKAGDYQHLIEQVKGKLTVWKSRKLSMVGRATLSKSILEAIPTYSMMSSMVPKSCLKEIPKIQMILLVFLINNHEF